MSKQDEIIEEVAAYHGISLPQAKDILNCLMRFTVDTINKGERVDGYFDETTFKTVHLHHFGTFRPNLPAIKAANKLIKNNRHELRK
jgi:nucleoid DNA-binding protein